MRKVTLTAKALFIVFVGFFIYKALFAPVETGKNLDSVNWLPNDATNISYHFESQFGWTKEYTCTINEKSFREFAQKEKWPLKPIANETVFLQKVMPKKINITKGLVYTDKKNYGGAEYIHYDIDTETLYYFATH